MTGKQPFDEPLNLSGILTEEQRSLAKQRDFEIAMHQIERDMPNINSRRGVEYYSGEYYGDR